MLVVLKLLALASCLGGPLLWTDAYKAQLGMQLSFGLAFAPLALLLVGGLALDDEPDAMQRWSRRSGVVGALLLCVQNAVALVWLWTDPERFASSRASYGVGIPIGIASAGGYLYLAYRRPPDLETLLRRAELGSLVRDWALLALSIAFVAAGLVLWPRDRAGAIVTIVFFGACGITPVLSLRRRVRGRRDSGWTLPADRTLRPRRATVLALFAGLLAGALVIFVFSASYPWLFRGLVALVGAVGALGLVAVALGRAPRGFVRFDAETLTLERSRYLLHVPWAALDLASAGEYMHNPAVFVSMLDTTRFTTTPPERRDGAVRELARNESWAGTPILILTTIYGVDARDLAEAITREIARH